MYEESFWYSPDLAGEVGKTAALVYAVLTEQSRLVEISESAGPRPGDRPGPHFVEGRWWVEITVYEIGCMLDKCQRTIQTAISVLKKAGWIYAHYVYKEHRQKASWYAILKGREPQEMLALEKVAYEWEEEPAQFTLETFNINCIPLLSLNLNQEDVKKITPQSTLKTEEEPEKKPQRDAEYFRNMTRESLRIWEERKKGLSVDLSPLPEYVRPWAEVFYKRVKMKFARREVGRWIKTVQACHDYGIDLEAYRAGIDKLLKDGLTISGPESVIGTARSLMAARTREESSDLWTEVF